MKHEHIEWFSEEDDRRRFQRQALVTLIFIALIFGAILFRLFSLQILRGDYYLELSEKNRLRIYRLLPSRGLMLDRKGKIIVDNKLGFDLLYRPVGRKEELTDEQVKLIATTLSADESTLKNLINEASSYAPSKIAADLNYDTLAKCEEALNIIGRDKGVYIELTPKRSYPYPQLIPHFLGYTREISPEELSKNPKTYSVGDLIGKSGIEQSYEQALRGIIGTEWIEENAFHQRLRTIKIEPAKAGKNLYLTIDLDLNLKVAEIFGDRAGAAVVMDVNTGGILAAYSNPSFDPSIFSGKLKPEEWQAIIDNPDRPLVNKVISGLYPPGSVIKPVIALAALQNRVIDPQYPVTCTGIYNIGIYEYRCWKEGGHGTVALHDAIVQSCDFFFYRIAEMTGIERLATFAKKCGFGAKTGIEISGEKSGLVPDREWKQRIKKQPWHLGETLYFGIGQGYMLVTPLQLAVFYSALAHGGEIIKPRIIDRIEDPITGQIETTKVETVGNIPTKEENIEFVNRALLDVVESGGGTGHQANIAGIDVAGKTGTAQVVSEQNNKVEIEDHAWFAAFAPFEQPEICVVVLIEHGGKGGAVAAPVAREIIKAYFDQKNVNKEETAPQSGNANAQD